MEAAAKSIESQVSNQLPIRPHHLSISPEAKYQQHARDHHLEEEAIRQLQYMTFLSDVDRGILLTRAYFDIRKDPEPIPEYNAPSPPKQRTDPNKRVTKLSFNDYKNRKKETSPAEANSPGNINALQSKASGPKPHDKDATPVRPSKKENGFLAPDDMLRKTVPKKAHPSLPPKPDVRVPGESPSPEKKKRPSEGGEERFTKKSKIDSGVPSVPSRPPPKLDTPGKLDRPISHERKPSREIKTSMIANGRSAVSSSGHHGVSPQPGSQVNGSQKSFNSNHSTPRKDKGSVNSDTSASIPPLISPLGREEVPRGEMQRRALKKLAEREEASSKSQIKKPPREELEPLSIPPKKPRLKIPELLSPTLPPIVREAQVQEKKELSQKSNTAQSDSPGSSAKKAPMKAPREDTIHVDRKKEEDVSTLIVKMKYPKKISKTISRLLALAPRKKGEVQKREDRSGRERSESTEPAPTARKRPRAATDATEVPIALKRPKTADMPQPMTPSSKHTTTSMQRVASGSSQAGTPGVTQSLTPAAPNPSDRRQTPVDLEKAARLRKQHSDLVSVGTRMKHRRDGIVKSKDGSNPQPSQRERFVIMAAAIQSTTAYMTAFKAWDDSREAERKSREPNNWRSLAPVLRMYRNDCSMSNQGFALFLRLQAISLVWYTKCLWAVSMENPSATRELFQSMKDQELAWRAAETSRKRLGIFDGSPGSEDGGSVGKLLDRLGPWSTSEDVVTITIKILRKVIRLDNEKFTPEPELLHAFEPVTNGN